MQDSIFIEGAPTIFIQDYDADPLNNPDSDGFYYGLSGTSALPVYEVGCLSDLSFTEEVTLNDILCDNLGIQATVQQRQFVEFQFTVKSMFPIVNMAQLLSLSAVTENTTIGEEKVGIGKINNNQFWHVWAPAVYDTDTFDYVAIHLHKCQFVDAWTINTPFGDAWTVSGLRLRAVVDSTYPAAQQFGVIYRYDPSVLQA